MAPPDSKRLLRQRVDEDQPTVIDPALASAPAMSRGSSQRLAAVADALDDAKTVISQRPPPASAWSGSSGAMELGALLQGKQLGHFTLEKFVGGGGMGAVFRGRDNLLGRIVAVKVLSRDQGSDPETLRRFKNEAQSAARLDHDNIARVFFVGEDDGWNYIVFEFIDGVNIRDLVDRDGPLPLELAIDFTIQIAEALAHAAEREVVHRDIKPSNILVTPDRHAKLVDMGLARLHQMEAGQSDLTASGVTLGTFDYISPEQASDPRRADVRSDLYSLGCTLFFMLTGRPPFPQGTVLQKLLAHSGEAPPDLRDDRPDLPEAVTKIVHRLMAKRPEQRYRDPAELIGELLVLRERLGLAQYGADGAWVAQAVAMPWRERALAWGAPLALLVVLLVGLNAYWSSWSSQADPLPAFRKPTQRVQPLVSPEITTPVSHAGGATQPARDDRAATSESPSSAAAVVAANSNSSSSPPTRMPTESGAPASNSPEANLDNAADPTPNSSATKGPLHLVVIGDASQLGDFGDSIAVFSSLGEALGDAEVQSQLAQLEAIEIRAAVVEEAVPLAIHLPQGSELVIRGIPTASGDLPIVRFGPLTADPASTNGAIVDISGSKTSWENLHLQWEVPAASQAGERALLRVAADAGAHLQFQSCVVTVVNPPARSAPEVAFIEIQTTRGERPAGVVPLNLRDSIFRGRATLVRLRESLGLDLDWRNGLLVSNSPLLQADGARQPFDDSGAGTIRLRLDDLTISTTSDLCQLRDTLARPHQPALELDCNRCIITADGSLVMHDGIRDAAQYAQSLHISGSHNFYEGIDDFWRAYVKGALQQTWDWPVWKKLLMRDGMPSYTGPVRWNRLRSDVLAVPLHLQGKDDYALDPAASNPAVRDNAGFVADALPPLVRDAEAEPTTAADGE